MCTSFAPVGDGAAASAEVVGSPAGLFAAFAAPAADPDALVPCGATRTADGSAASLTGAVTCCGASEARSVPGRGSEQPQFIVPSLSRLVSWPEWNTTCSSGRTR